MNSKKPLKKCNRTMKPQRAIGLLVLIVLSFAMLLPVFIMLSTSLKIPQEIYQFPPSLFPEKLEFSNFSAVFTTLNYTNSLLNSITISALVVVFTILSSSLVAFGFSRYNAPGKKVLFMLLLSTLMIPYPCIMIPQFILFNNLSWINTFLPLVVPSLFGSAYMVFMLRQFFASLDNELFDAARIDGCSEFRNYWNIALPLCKPALATVAIFSFIWSWDDLLAPVIYLNDTEKYTLPILLASMTNKYRLPPWNTMMCAALLTSLPAVLLFAFCQKYFVEGIVTTGMKS